MRTHVVTGIFLLAIVSIVLFALPAMAQEETATELNAAPLPAGWMILVGRIGGSTGPSGGTFTFDNVPRGEDEETSFSSPGGFASVTGIEAMFFPTQGRHFMLTASLSGQTGFAPMTFEEEEYGYKLGMNDKIMVYHIGDLLGGVGYRFLYGDRRQHMTALYGKVGLGNSIMAIDGFGHDSGGSAVVEIGANYLYRFDNRMIVGTQLDLRAWGAFFNEMEIDSLDTEANMGFGGGTAIISLVIGWETM